MRWPQSLRARIALAAVAAVGVCGMLAGGLLLAAVERDGRNQVDAELRERANSILRRPPDRGYGRDGYRSQPLLRGSGTFAQVAYGDEVERAGDVPADPPDVPQEDGEPRVLHTVRGVGWALRA